MAYSISGRRIAAKVLNRRGTDRRLRKYIKEHIAGGHSPSAVKTALVRHGYDGDYIEGMLKKHSEMHTMKKYAVFAMVFIVALTLAFNFLWAGGEGSMATGYAVSADKGFCDSALANALSDECYGKAQEPRNDTQIN